MLCLILAQRHVYLPTRPVEHIYASLFFLTPKRLAMH